MAEWEKEKAASIVNRWLVLDPKATSATNRSTFTKEPDGSIVVSGRNRNGVVTIVAETELTGITGLRLEVLTDSRLPNKGPGRATDGNFVLNELELTAAPKADPKQAKPVKLANALADFSQHNLEVAKAIDGSLNDPANGWAVSPATGVIHWATFETSEPIGGAGGTVLTINMHHKFGETWTLGRFRLSVTRGAKPIGLSLPEDFRAILATAPDVRTDAQKNLLAAYFRAVDAELRQEDRRRERKQGALADRSQAQSAARPARVRSAAHPARSGAHRLATRSGDQRPASRHPAADRRPGYHLGLDQQPGVLVQPLTHRHDPEGGRHVLQRLKPLGAPAWSGERAGSGQGPCLCRGRRPRAPDRAVRRPNLPPGRRRVPAGLQDVPDHGRRLGPRLILTISRCRW